MHILKESSFSRPYFEAGEKRGELKGAKKILILQGQARFGRLDKATRARIKSIDDVERLEDLSVRLLNVTSWADLLSEEE
jgi:hypothetical protein